MQCCWDQDPFSRPEVSEVSEILRGGPTSASTLRSTNLQSIPSSKSASRNIRGMESAVDRDQGLDGDEGKYWLKPQHSKKGSLSVPNIGGMNQMSRDPSGMHLPRNLFKDNLAQQNKSKSDRVGNSNSRLNQANPSKRGLSETNGNPTGNASQYELSTRTADTRAAPLKPQKPTITIKQGGPGVPQQGGVSIVPPQQEEPKPRGFFCCF